MKTVFEFKGYREFLVATVADHGSRHGLKTLLAEAAGCQRSYLSQVMNGEAQLTPDHALGLCQFWGFDGEERDFFMDLVNLERARTKQLRTLIQIRLDALLRSRSNLAARLQAETPLSGNSEFEYYATWYMSAIHVAISIPECRSPNAIANRLNLKEQTVQIALEKLRTLGLVERINSEWRQSQKNIHVPKDSPTHKIHHCNWRQQAIREVAEQQEESLHYTAVHSLSRKDLPLFKNLIIKLIEETRALVAPSAEEEIICFNVDFFALR